jgi:hypothetical protein
MCCCAIPLTFSIFTFFVLCPGVHLNWEERVVDKEHWETRGREEEEKNGGHIFRSVCDGG